MARIRTIKPNHCTDKELPNISLQAHLLWILNWCFSDDEGVFENDPLLIKSNLFPRRQDVRTEQINQWLDQLVKARYIIPFTHNGVGYFLNRTFNIHQRIDRPQPSTIPSDTIQRLIADCSANIRPCIVRESIVKESKVVLPASPKKKDDFIPTPKQIESFENFKRWMDEHTPTVAKMEKPITIKELFILRGLLPNSKGVIKEIPKDECLEMLLAIENNKVYLKKYRSPYMCILAWHRNNKK